jgi:hypothetical protein
MKYQYQVDYGSGYEDFFPDGQELADEDEQNPSLWLAKIEADITARRARVLRGSELVEERDFTCTVSQDFVQPDGSTEYSVQCSGGNISVERDSRGKLTGEVSPGFAGDADTAVERAIEAVRKLNKI